MGGRSWNLAGMTTPSTADVALRAEIAHSGQTDEVRAVMPCPPRRVRRARGRVAETLHEHLRARLALRQRLRPKIPNVGRQQSHRWRTQVHSIGERYWRGVIQRYCEIATPKLASRKHLWNILPSVIYLTD